MNVASFCIITPYPTTYILEPSDANSTFPFAVLITLALPSIVSLPSVPDGDIVHIRIATAVLDRSPLVACINAVGNRDVTLLLRV